MENYDYAIIGAGVIGLGIALRLRSLHPNAKILVMEKESSAGCHASGRNSGVIHAGFYYSADSLKAKLTRQGNLSMHEFCEEQGIEVQQCGKLVVCKNGDELKQLAELKRRGDAYGVPLEELDVQQVRELEPRAKTWEKALFSPSTSTVNPLEVVAALCKLLQQKGVDLSFEEAFVSYDGQTLRSSKRNLQAGMIVNCAGTYAAEIAKQFGFAKDYRILPFRGLYLYSNEEPGQLRTNIYPVPPLEYPFLGVHLTLSHNKKVKIGPTATPAFWNEQYNRLDNFSWREMMAIALMDSQLFFSRSYFRTLAINEGRKWIRKHLVGQAQDLAEKVSLEQYRKWGKPGIRAQLVDWRKKSLEMDFVIQGDSKSLHILNAVSPAFTCTFSFSEFACNQMQ